MCAAHTPSGLRVRRCWQGRMAAQDFTTRPYEQEEQEEEEEQEEQEEQEEEEGGGRRRWRWCGRVEEDEERSVLEVSLLEVFKSNIQHVLLEGGMNTMSELVGRSAGLPGRHLDPVWTWHRAQAAPAPPVNSTPCPHINQAHPLVPLYHTVRNMRASHLYSFLQTCSLSRGQLSRRVPTAWPSPNNVRQLI